MSTFKFNGSKLTWASDPKLRVKLEEINAQIQKATGVRFTLKEAKERLKLAD